MDREGQHRIKVSREEENKSRGNKKDLEKLDMDMTAQCSKAISIAVLILLT